MPKNWFQIKKDRETGHDDSEEKVEKKKDAQAATGKWRNPRPEGEKLKVQDRIDRKKHAKSKLSE